MVFKVKKVFNYFIIVYFFSLITMIVFKTHMNTVLFVSAPVSHLLDLKPINFF